MVVLITFPVILQTDVNVILEDSKPVTQKTQLFNLTPHSLKSATEVEVTEKLN